MRNFHEESDPNARASEMLSSASIARAIEFPKLRFQASGLQLAATDAASFIPHDEA
jgi:hypothetical protein